MRGAGIKQALRVLAALLILAPLYLVARAPSASAQTSLAEDPALISADQVSYDQNLDIVTASGNVEISQGGRILLADRVTHNIRTNVVTASGNVAILEPSGEVVFADFVELSGDLQEGLIRDIRILLTDRSRLAAASGLRTEKNKTLVKKGVFSPCDLCRDDPTRAPLWQLKALEIEHDQEERTIRYRDAWMEIFGVPVFYTPYLEHPDPTVDRKSGFLAPTFGGSAILGTTYQQPYFWAMDRNRDLTIAPLFTSEQSVNLAADYRHLLPFGKIDVFGGGTFADRTDSDGTIKSNRFRGYIDGTMRFDIDRTWRSGLDVQRSTDDTYPRIYGFSNERTLTSKAFFEGFDGRDYFSAQSQIYQGLRETDRQDESPIILPLIDYNFISEPGLFGGRYSLDTNLLVLTRPEGRDSRRLSAALAWERPFQGPLGDLYNVTARVQTDGYWVDGVDPASNEVNPANPAGGDLIGRVFPQLAINWRYPWVSHDGGIRQVIEPIAQVVVGPNGANPGEIPNEDSLDFEFDDTNLFSLNRFTGIDRVDPGTRFDYGLGWTITGDGGGYSSVFVGQSYRWRDEAVFAQGSGLQGDFSDVVGRIQVRPSYGLDLTYRFRFDKDDLRARRSELDLRIGPPIFNLSLEHIFIDSEASADEFDDREELNWTLRSQFSPRWSTFAGHRFDLANSQSRRVRVGVNYKDECFSMRLVAERNFFADREITPEYTVFMSFVFKHLGGVSNTDILGFGG